MKQNKFFHGLYFTEKHLKKIMGRVSFHEETGNMYIVHSTMSHLNDSKDLTPIETFGYELKFRLMPDLLLKHFDIYTDEKMTTMVFVTFSESFTNFLRDTSKKSIVSAMLSIPINTTTAFCDYVTNRGEHISYLPKGKTHKSSGTTWSKENRQLGKPGKIVRKLLREEVLCTLKDKDFEEFANLYKAMCDKAGTFRIVEGEEIAKWYAGKNSAAGQGTLNSSCMRGMHHDTFDFYGKNPEIIKMLILVDDKEKLLGRALVWHLGEEKFVDRIYANDASVELFKIWAEDNGYMYKRTQSYSDKEFFIKDGQEINKTYDVDLKEVIFPYYPYLDTFSYLNRTTKQVSNTQKSPYWDTIQSTDGGYDRGDYGYEGDYDEDYDEDEVIDCVTGDMIGRYDDDTICLSDGRYTHCDNAKIDYESDDWVLINDLFSCDWSGHWHRLSRGIFTVDGEHVFVGHRDLITLYNGTYVRDTDTFISDVSGVRFHKSERSMVEIPGKGSVSVAESELESFLKANKIENHAD